jgi:hypothetical protein
LKKFLLYSIINFTLYLPAIVKGTSVRIDTILIYIYLIYFLFEKKNLSIKRKYLFVIRPFLYLVTGVFISLSYQLIFLNLPISNALVNLNGYLRPLLFALLGALLIENNDVAIKLSKLILLGAIFHGVVSIIEYTDFPLISFLINHIYRDGSDLGSRAIGAFDTVHDLAYFSLYMFLFSFFLAFFKRDDVHLGLSYLAMLFSLFSIILTFSKGAYLSLIVVLLFIFFKNKSLRKYIIRATLLFVSVFLVFSIFNQGFFNYFLNELTVIESGVKFILGMQFEIDPGFVTGRLDHGWQNAIHAWQMSPLFGNLKVSIDTFIGDGGYTEVLANHGLVGLIFLFLFLLDLAVTKKSGANSVSSLHLVLVSFVFAFLISLTATGFLKPRSMELLPLMFICLYYRV